MLLAAAVVGSGIMAERLFGGNLAIALLANTAATVAAFGPVSGAHFNPAVSMMQALRGQLSIRHAAAYALVQTLGCRAGALLAHAMFHMPLIQTSIHTRSGAGQWLSEVVATAGLLLVVLSSATTQVAAVRVPAWIGAAY